jgi:hypothetical protein
VKFTATTPSCNARQVAIGPVDFRQPTHFMPRSDTSVLVGLGQEGNWGSEVQRNIIRLTSPELISSCSHYTDLISPASAFIHLKFTMPSSPWYHFGRDKAHKTPNTATTTAGNAQQQEPEEEEDSDDGPTPVLIKGRTSSNRIVRNAENSGLIRQYYKRYELDWPKLRGWLEQKFPKAEFPNVNFKEIYVRLLRLSPRSLLS